jgi:TonB family protein
MKLRVLLLIALTCSPFTLRAKTVVYAFKGIGQSAIDASGLRHSAESYPGHHPPWDDDRIKTVPPEYSFWDRMRRHMGNGRFRLRLDLKTGAVTKVDTLQSTGFASLDKSAISAFRQWRWKPGKWKEIDVPVTFVLAQHE